MPERKLSIIIPVFNEEQTIAALLDRVREAPLSIAKQLVVVNDGSSDQSPAIIEKWQADHPDIELATLSQENRGKGSAVRTGIQNSDGDIIIVQDADLEYDPADIQKCIEPILAGDAKIVYGSRERFNENHQHSSWTFYIGGMLVSLWFSILYLTWITDEPTCYKTFDGKLIRTLLFEADGFEWEPEITSKLLRLGFKIHEVPISYRPRKVDEGKKIKWTDGVRALWEALRWRIKSVAAERAKLND